MKQGRTQALRDRVRLEVRSVPVNGDARNWEDIGERWLELAEDWNPDDDAPGDGAGNTQGEFRRVGPAFLRCEVTEIDGGEQVLAARAEGTSTVYVMLRASRFVNAITTDDVLVQILPGNIERRLNVRYAPPPGKNEYRTFQCEQGVAE